jgi:hypothetical protein
MNIYKSGKYTSNNYFQTLAIRQQKAVIPERREPDEVNHAVDLVFYLEVLVGLQHSREIKHGFAEDKRQILEFKATVVP